MTYDGIQTACKAPYISVHDLDELLATCENPIMVYVRSEFCGPCKIVDKILYSVGNVTVWNHRTDSWGDTCKEPAEVMFGRTKTNGDHYSKGLKKPIRGVHLDASEEQVAMWAHSHGIDDYPVMAFFKEADLHDKILGITNNSEDKTKEHMFHIIESINTNDE